jgi:hypothetical protein
MNTVVTLGFRDITMRAVEWSLGNFNSDFYVLGGVAVLIEA